MGQWWRKMKGFILVVLIIPFSSVLANTNKFIIEEGIVNVSGGNVWYKIVKSEKTQYKTPLLILHGGPGVPHDYLNVLKSLAVDRPVIFYDQLGCGHSQVSKPDDALWTVNRFETELEQLVSHLHLKAFHLFGHSWGGALAIRYALKHPETLKSLTLASPLLSTNIWIADSKTLLSQLSPSTRHIILINEQRGTTNSPDYLQAVDVYYHHFICRMKKWPRDLNYSFEHLNDNVYKTMWGPNEFTVTGNLKDFDEMSNLQHFKMPILLTGGKYDGASPKTLAHAVKKLPNGRLIIYEKSAHMAFLEEKNKYLRDLRLFLKDVDENK